MKIRDEALKYYFYFIEERMNIFWKRYEGETTSLSTDKIFTTYKFTNVYRVLDRVSQFLIQKVIYVDSSYQEMDVLLRIILFKIFNNIATWKYLEDKLGNITLKTFNADIIAKLLAERIEHTPIFNAAYMMTGTHKNYNEYSSKHEKWLRMVEKELIAEKVFVKILNAKSLNEVFSLLQNCSFIGGFLAYQYAIDFNYSNVIDFDENSFVKAGIGAIRGIKKCFSDVGNYTYEDCIRYVHDNFSTLQDKYECNGFKNLFGRMPTLIDLQNCFCETDKYLRVKMPELQVDNVRIKQKFNAPKANFDIFLPPKWNLNQFIKPASQKIQSN